MLNWKAIFSFTGITAYLLFACTEAPSASFGLRPFYKGDKSTMLPSQTILAELPDGAYQFCTEPDPQDWTDGAGVCLNVVKQGLSVSGYYGYPHSSHFICLRGELSAEKLTGQALFISWSAHEWTEIPQESFFWDDEGRLSLEQGSVIPSEDTAESEGVDRIIFQQANLNTQGLYTYSSPRMWPPEQICDESIWPTAWPTAWPTVWPTARPALP